MDVGNLKISAVCVRFSHFRDGQNLLDNQDRYLMSYINKIRSSIMSIGHKNVIRLAIMT